LSGEKIRDEFVDFRACVALEGVVRATQEAKAEMRIKIGSVKTDIYEDQQLKNGSPFFWLHFLWRSKAKKSNWCASYKLDGQH